MSRFFLLSGSLLGFLSVALGAFGAHALKARLTPADLDIFKTGTQYQILHAMVLIAVGVWLRTQPSVWLERSGIAFLLGTVIFSGTLYLLVGTQARWWGAITPVGGVFLLTGWALLFLASGKS